MDAEANTNDKVDLAPAVLFTADCDKPPLTGYPCPSAVAILAADNASSS